MSFFSLELIANAPPEVIYLPLSAHVHKYIDRFLYTDRIDDSSVPLVYFESVAMDSHRNLQLIDSSWSIGVNDLDYGGSRDNWVVIESKSYSSPYSSIAATNIVITDDRGELRPLFYRHSLPANTVEAIIEVVDNGKVVEVEPGYLLDLVAGNIYTNFRNQFDQITGAYRLYYIISTNADGKSTTELLNPVPTAKLATWEDLTPDGKMTTAYSVYSIEKNSSGYTYYFNSTGPWYIRTISASVIKPFLPTGRSSKDTWYLRFSAGDFTTFVNNKVRRYWFPEFEVQNYFPSKPYIYSPYRSVLWVNSRTIYANRDKISVNPNKYMHFELFVYDPDEVLIRVLSTDSLKHGQRYSDTEIFIESDKIFSWDNNHGFVSFGIDLDSANSYYAAMFYEADDLECTHQSLNPLHNKNALDYMWIYYVVPDVDEKDRALHLLGIAKDGKIAYCSQPLGFSYPNLQLLNSDGTVNSNSVIGMKYISADPTEETFTKLYTSSHLNDYSYFVVAEVLCLDTSAIGDSFVCDATRSSGIVDDHFEEAVRANPRVLQSPLGCGEDGLQVPESGVILMHPSLSLLEDYGGVLTKEQAEELLKTYVPAATSVIFIWEKIESAIYGNSYPTYNEIIATWEGPYLVYSLYKRTSALAEWVFIDKVANPPEGPIVFQDYDITSNNTYYYSVRIEKNGIEYSASNFLSMKAR